MSMRITTEQDFADFVRPYLPSPDSLWGTHDIWADGHLSCCAYWVIPVGHPIYDEVVERVEAKHVRKFAELQRSDVTTAGIVVTFY